MCAASVEKGKRWDTTSQTSLMASGSCFISWQHVLRMAHRAKRVQLRRAIPQMGLLPWRNFARGAPIRRPLPVFSWSYSHFLSLLFVEEVTIVILFVGIYDTEHGFSHNLGPPFVPPYGDRSYHSGRYRLCARLFKLWTKVVGIQ